MLQSAPTCRVITFFSCISVLEGQDRIISGSQPPVPTRLTSPPRCTQAVYCETKMLPLPRNSLPKGLMNRAITCLRSSGSHIYCRSFGCQSTISNRVDQKNFPYTSYEHLHRHVPFVVCITTSWLRGPNSGIQFPDHIWSTGAQIQRTKPPW